MTDISPPSWINFLWTAFSAVAGALMAVILWNVRRQVASHDELCERVRELEKDRVTKGDISYIADQVNDLRSDMANQHAQILNTIISVGRQK